VQEERINNIMTEIAKKPSKKIRIGVVSSNKMDKTITVQVERRLRHPIYGKYVKKTKKFMAHDETNDCKIGDTVKITESRPLSAKKRWRLVEVLERAK
jgi:small subunit ribosomal protein S17